MDNVIYASAVELAQAIRARKVSSEEVVNAYLKRIEEINPKINAVVQVTADTALSQAHDADASLGRGEIKGPLHGVPMTVKDIIETAGVICTAGTQGLASHVPTTDATVVARLRHAGAILLGKTNLPELALAYESDNLVYGRTSNPYDLSCTPGGSSGGEAAIIAAGGSPFGIGNDAGGSIRLPAHFCGIAGIKPTTGRVPATGTVVPPGGLMSSLFQTGPMARFVEDLTLTLPIICGIDWRDPTVVPMPLDSPAEVDLKSLRIAFYTDNGIMTPTPETEKTVKKAAKLLADEGICVAETRPEGIEESYEIALDLFCADGGVRLQTLLQMIGTTEVHPLLQRRQEIVPSRAMTSPELFAFMHVLDTFRSTMTSFLEKYDVIICPVCAYPALPHGASFDEDKAPGFSYSMTYNLTGWPGVVVRGGTSPEGLPIGVQVVARPWREDVALAVALQIETVLGGWQRPTL